jgi:hypothetical protein
MRELTSAELEYISGGTEQDIEDIIVTGTPYQPPYYYPPSYYPPSYYPPSYYPGGGGSPTPPPTDDYCADQEAMQGADEIEAKNNDNSKEWGSLVYKAADGKILHSPPLGGTGDTIPLSAYTDWMTANNISWSQIQGMVHNHPANVYDTSEAAADINRYPSVGDWGFATYAMNQGAAASFSLYINDTGGTLREFTNANRALYENLTNQQKDDGRNLPSTTRACGS